MTQFASSVFPGTNGTELATSDANWIKQTGHTANAVLDGAGSVGDQFGNFNIYRHQTTPPGADYVVSADVFVPSANYSGGVTARNSSSADTFYIGYYDNGGAEWRLYSYIAGVGTIIGTYAGDLPTTARRIKLTCLGTTISLTIDANVRISVTDSSISAAGFAGIGPIFPATGTLKNFSADSLGPTINTQPTPQTAYEGFTATYTIAATTSGGTLHYQWKVNGVNSGTDSSSFTTATLVLADSGAVITCDVSDTNGTTTSASALLTVTAFVNQHPGSQVVRVGDVPRFYCEANPPGSTFQWKRDTGGGYINAAGTSTNAEYFGSAAVLGDDGYLYKCEVTYTAVTKTSNVATLKVVAVLPATLGEFTPEMRIESWW